MPLRIEWRSEHDWIVCDRGEWLPLRVVLDTRGLVSPPDRVQIERIRWFSWKRMLDSGFHPVAKEQAASTDVIWLHATQLMPRRYRAAAKAWNPTPLASGQIVPTRRFWVIPRSSPWIGATLLGGTAFATIYYLNVVLRTLHFTLTDLGLGLSGVAMLTILSWARTLAGRARASEVPPQFGIGLMWPRTLGFCALLLSLVGAVGDRIVPQYLVTIKNDTTAKVELDHSLYGYLELPQHREVTLTQLDDIEGASVAQPERFRVVAADPRSPPDRWPVARPQSWRIECVPPRWPIAGTPLATHPKLSRCPEGDRDWCLEPADDCTVETTPWALLPIADERAPRSFRVMRRGEDIERVELEDRDRGPLTLSVNVLARPEAITQTAIPRDCEACRFSLDVDANLQTSFEIVHAEFENDPLVQLEVRNGNTTRVDGDGKAIGSPAGSLACALASAGGRPAIALTSFDWYDPTSALAGIRVRASDGPEHSWWEFAVSPLSKGRAWACLDPGGKEIIDVTLRRPDLGEGAAILIPKASGTIRDVTLRAGHGQGRDGVAHVLAVAACSNPPDSASPTPNEITEIISIKHSTKVVALRAAGRASRGETWEAKQRDAPLIMCVGRSAADPQQTIAVEVTTQRGGRRNGRVSFERKIGRPTIGRLEVDLNYCDPDGRPAKKGCKTGSLKDLLETYPRAQCDVVVECQ